MGQRAPATGNGSGALTLPVPGCGWKYSLAARRLRRAVQAVCGRAPDGVVGRRPMRLQRRLVPVYFVEVIDVLVLPILKDVEAHAARFVPLRAEGIDLDRLEEPLARTGLHPTLHPHCQHCVLLWLGSSRPRSF